MLQLLTTANGTRPLCRDVRDHGESWRVSGPPADIENLAAEVLGDRVRCDVRYTELKIPESEYREFVSTKKEE